MTLPWRGLLLLCLPSSGGFLLGPCGRVCVGVWCVWVGVWVRVGVRVPAGSLCWLESRFLLVSMFCQKAIQRHLIVCAS